MFKARLSDGRPLQAMVFACLVLAGSIFALASPAKAEGPKSVADLAENLLDSVVNISTAQTVTGNRRIPTPQVPDGSPFQEFFDEFFNRQNKNGDRPRRVQSLGSGFVVSQDGIIITNNHVIEGADEITANFNDGSKLKAEIIGRDPKTDLAVLKVNPEPGKPLKVVKLGDSAALRVGDWVMAIGNPFGLGGTVTVGIVSALNRDINSGPYDNFLQTDASINRGNSGGPLFNMDGEVIGINTAIISPSGGSIGIGFAIPSNNADDVIDQLREFGETRRGWLGVRIQQVTDDLIEGLKMSSAKGALVAGITPTGPADKSGIKTGDVILEFDGKPVPTMRDLPRMVANTPVGKEVEVTVLRKGEEVKLGVELGRLEEGEKLEVAARSPDAENTEEEKKTSNVLGMTIEGMTPELRKKFELSEKVDGVVITEVKDNSSAADKRIQAGDVILQVDMENVASPDDVQKRITETKDRGSQKVVLLLSNKTGDIRFVGVRLE